MALHKLPKISNVPPVISKSKISEDAETLELIEILDWMREQDSEIREGDYAELAYQKWKKDEDDDVELLAEEVSSISIGIY